jgi:sugar lactone lactonase YvrE
VWVCDFDVEGNSLGEPQIFLSGFERGLPDGSTVDAEGHLWNCRFGGGCVVRVSPAGVVNSIIEVGVTNVTTCTFGGPEISTLLVTTGAGGAPERERMAGSLFAFDTNVQGLPERCFALHT